MVKIWQVSRTTVKNSWDWYTIGNYTSLQLASQALEKHLESRGYTWSVVQHKPESVKYVIEDKGYYLDFQIDEVNLDQPID
jgi:hypothetical protein